MREGVHSVGHIAKLDVSRQARTGVPEVVLAEGKLDHHLVAICREFVEVGGRVVVSRLEESRLPLFRDLPCSLHYYPEARCLVLARPGFDRPRTGGRVAIFAAGTADIPVAMEARVIAEELGCDVTTVFDVGVAGIHRLFPELAKAREADVVIVAAGREGALAPVMAGLVDKPVIGLPVSTGYGHAGKGEAALSTMLQSCSPLVTVNIDAGFVAAASAAKIANAVAKARNEPSAVPQPVSVDGARARHAE
ncbi:MAG TPA: nickel pincer cofactor biosynthesis protein LarB [Candidatus Thermoplasmatota archaeon]|nr:nickel pincer cofactor biosynthesis protein LarB [Candidatus Thermoplasmatota archaeon]